MTDHILFNLEAAKRGEPIQFRNGEKCTFVAHFLAASPDCQLVVCTSGGQIHTRKSDGRVGSLYEMTIDVVMAPKPVVRYVHFVKDVNECWADTRMHPISVPNMVSRIKVECVPGYFDD